MNEISSYTRNRLLVEEAYLNGWWSVRDGSSCTHTHRAMISNWNRGRRHGLADQAMAS